MASHSLKARILLIGGSGMIGSRIVSEAASRGHPVIAASRNPERIVLNTNISSVALDATDAEALGALAERADVMVSSVSPRGGGDPVDEARKVAKAVLQVATAKNKRILFVGGAGSLLTADGSAVIDKVPPERREPFAMKEVLAMAKGSDADWTYFSPALQITPGERTGRFRVGSTALITDAAGQSRISAEDYAVAMLDEIETPSYRRAQMTVGY
jgi:uncharacterized protein